MRAATLLLLVVGCRSNASTTSDAGAGAPAESATEFRGVAISPPAKLKPQADGDEHRRRPSAGKLSCHMLDGTPVDSCAAGDTLCSCD